jgi:hypothetical protein
MNQGPAKSSFVSLEDVVFPRVGLYWEDGGGDPPADPSADPAPPPADDWRAGLDPEIASHPSMKDFKSLGDVAKSWVNVQSLIGVDKIPIPAAEDSAAWNEVYKRLGRPESADGYELDAPSDLPEGLPYSKDLEKEFREKAFAAGLSARAVKEIFNWYIGAQKADFTRITEQTNASLQQYREAAEGELKKEWGMAYDSKVKDAQSLVTSFADEKDLGVLKQIGNNPAVVRFLAKIAGVMGEDTIRPGGSPRGDFLTPQAAQSEISKVMGDSKHPYFHRNHPEHKLAVDRMAQLELMAYGKEDKPVK